MRIVADTNNVLSELLWQGPPRQIVDRAHAGAITLHTSLILLAELAEVMGRGKFTRRIQSARLSAAGLVDDYRHLAVLIDPQPLPAPVRRDADDDHVRACALTAGAAPIVSGDQDLLDLGTFRNIAILNAVAALEAIVPASG